MAVLKRKTARFHVVGTAVATPFPGHQRDCHVAKASPATNGDESRLLLVLRCFPSMYFGTKVGARL